MVGKGPVLRCPGKLVMADSVTLKTLTVVGNEQVGDLPIDKHLCIYSQRQKQHVKTVCVCKTENEKKKVMVVHTSL